MKVNVDDCTGCKICLDYCNVGAISIADEVASIDNNVCVECWVCYRNQVCPNDCFEPTHLTSFGDVFKHVLSDPMVTNKGTGIPGRGTEECKTNDVSGRFRKNFYGICIDMGRPGIGVYLSDVEKVAMAVAAEGVRFSSPKENPLSVLMTDIRSGKIRDDLLYVHVLSVIIEGTCRRDKFAHVLKTLLKVEKEIDTVFSLGIVSMVGEDKDEPLMKILEEFRIQKPFRGKVNVGLGRPTFQD
jgi:NAD-dependent dihydropyrimidine dehydrogenase PreA subunit